jgi:hypothetical protein
LCFYAGNSLLKHSNNSSASVRSNFPGKKRRTGFNAPEHRKALTTNSSARAAIDLAKTKTLEIPFSASSQIRQHIETMTKEAEPKLNLTTSELDTLTAIVIDLMKINGVLKAERSKLKTYSDGTILVTIPPQPELANEVWKFFQDQLASKMSPEKANLIDDSLGERMMQWFWGYGAGEEIYRLTPSKQKLGNYDYDFSAQIAKDMPRTAVSVIGNRYGGGGDSGTNSSLEKLVSFPQYEFLTEILPNPPKIEMPASSGRAN